jgi:hypothetical protein
MDWRILVSAWAALACAPAQAGTPTPVECREGGEFIRNAALARDAGMPREDFIGRMQTDFVLIRAFPPELRWFVKDEADEAFLLAEASAVFDKPQPPARHEEQFLRHCLVMAGEIPFFAGRPDNGRR